MANQAETKVNQDLEMRLKKKLVGKNRIIWLDYNSFQEKQKDLTFELDNVLHIRYKEFLLYPFYLKKVQ